MATVVITLKDTPDGGVSAHAQYDPPLANPCSQAQLAALDLIFITARDWRAPQPQEPSA